MKFNAMILAGALAAIFLVAGCASTGGGGTAGGGALPMQLNELLERTMSTINGISGSDQAMAAHGTLMEVEAELADVVEKAPGSSPETRAELSKMAADALPGFESAANRALGIPGVSDVLGPTLANLSRQLGSLL